MGKNDLGLYSPVSNFEDCGLPYDFNSFIDLIKVVDFSLSGFFFFSCEKVMVTFKLFTR